MLRRREEEAGRRPGYRIKNKNPTQRCGEKGCEKAEKNMAVVYNQHKKQGL
jgi:hypothetical protein